jgi:thiamine kinase-like enzyme
VPSRHWSSARESGLHEQAGELLSRLHHAIPARQRPELTDYLINRASQWLDQAADLLSEPDRRFIQRHVAGLTDLGPLDAVVCHLDYQPRNWLVDETGTLRVIDFEHARIDLRPRDLVRLAFRSWTDRPDLRDAFLAGYGRRLTDTETRAVFYCAAIDVLTAIVRGNITGDAGLAEHGRATLRRLRADPTSL